MSAPGVFSGLLPSTGRLVDPGCHPQPGPLLAGAALAAAPGKCTFGESGGTEVAEQLVRGLSHRRASSKNSVPPLAVPGFDVCVACAGDHGHPAPLVLRQHHTLVLVAHRPASERPAEHSPSRCSSSCCCHRPSDPCVCAHIRHGCAGYQSLPRVYPTLWRGHEREPCQLYGSRLLRWLAAETSLMAPIWPCGRQVSPSLFTRWAVCLAIAYPWRELPAIRSLHWRALEMQT